MSNKNKHVVIAYFNDVDQADGAADQLKAWDKANDAVKLGGVGILRWDKSPAVRKGDLVALVACAEPTRLVQRGGNTVAEIWRVYRW